MSRFERNPAFEREIDAELEGHLRHVAVETATAVREVAPRHTGFYRRHVRPEGTRVVAADPFWHLVEYGSANNPPYAPLRRGVRAAGLRLDARRK